MRIIVSNTFSELDEPYKVADDSDVMLETTMSHLAAVYQDSVLLNLFFILLFPHSLFELNYDTSVQPSEFDYYYLTNFHYLRVNITLFGVALEEAF